eukprot:GILI01026504.1.p1 GENE.GILI01026504.1~~GILI01026504.1.p1  ORF type:complete len:280 (+),score=62.20 GILI01026504.1:70-909(+)
MTTSATTKPSSPISDPAVQRLENFLSNVLRKDLQKVLVERDNCYNAASQCVQLRQLLTDLADLGKVRTITVDALADEVPESDEATKLANAGTTVTSPPSPHGAKIDGITDENRSALNQMLGLKDSANSGRQTTLLHKSVTICDAQCADPTPLQLLCDVSGNNYFEAVANSEAGDQQQKAASTSAALASSHNNNNNYHFLMTADVPNPSLIHINIGCGVIAPMTHEEANAFLKKKEQLYRDQSQRLSRESLRVRFRIRLVMEAITRIQDQSLAVGGNKRS